MVGYRRTAIILTIICLVLVLFNIIPENILGLPTIGIAIALLGSVLIYSSINNC